MKQAIEKENKEWEEVLSNTKRTDNTFFKTEMWSEEIRQISNFWKSIV